MHKNLLNFPGPLPAKETAQILEWVDKYKLGQVISFQWNTYARYDEKADGIWYDDPERCPAAPIFRIDICGINQVLCLCGSVEDIQVMTSRISTGRPTPDNAMLSLRFSSGATGSVDALFCTEDGQRYPDKLKIQYEHETISTKITSVSDNFITTSKKNVCMQLAKMGMCLVMKPILGLLK